MESDLFWLCAIVQLFASLKFVFLVRQLDGRRVTAQVIKLASGQTTIIAIGASTTYHEQTSTIGASVSAGQTVSVKVSGLDGGPNGLNPGVDPGSVTGTQTATDVTITSK